MALQDIHVWLGRFDSMDRWQDYLEEHYDEDRDDLPLNQFAADQGEVFYDDDWIEYHFSDEPPAGSERAWLTQLLSGFSYTHSFLDAVIADALRAPLAGVNAVIGIDEEEIPNPRSVDGDGYELRFVGRYQRTPHGPGFNPAATELRLNDQRLTEVPSEVFELTGLVELSLGNNVLTSIPGEIGRLDNLEQVNLYGNQLTNLPDALFNLPRLRQIMAQENVLQSLPSVACRK